MPLRSVEAATREDAIAAAREQFGASARVVGVRRVRSGGVLGFFATERYVAEVDPEQSNRPPVPAPSRSPARGGAPSRNGAAAYAAEALASEYDDDAYDSSGSYDSYDSYGDGRGRYDDLRDRFDERARLDDRLRSRYDRMDDEPEPVRPRSKLTPAERIAAASAMDAPARRPDDASRLEELAGLLGAAAPRAASPLSAASAQRGGSPSRSASAAPAAPRSSLAAALAAAQAPRPAAAAPDPAPELPSVKRAPFPTASVLRTEPVREDSAEPAAAPAPSPFTAALARMVSGDRDVRQAVQEALDIHAAPPASRGAGSRPARPGSDPAPTAARPSATQQEDRTVAAQDLAPASPTDMPTWTEPVAPAYDLSREEAIAEVLRTALAQGHSDEALAGILRKVLAGAAPQSALTEQSFAAPAAPVQPALAEPILAEPILAEPILAEPILAEPILLEPPVTEPSVEPPAAFVPEPAPLEASEPVLAEPVLAEPVLAEPVLADGAVSEPVVSEPVVSEPVVSEPVVSEPVVSEPVLPEPVAEVPPGEPVLAAEPVDVTPEPAPVEPLLDEQVALEAAPVEPEAVETAAPASSFETLWGTAPAIAAIESTPEPVPVDAPIWADLAVHEPVPAVVEEAAVEEAAVEEIEEAVADIVETEDIEIAPVEIEDVALEVEPADEPAAEEIEEVTDVAPLLARTASDPAPTMSLDQTTVMPPLSLLPPLPGRPSRGRPPVPPATSRPAVPSRGAAHDAEPVLPVAAAGAEPLATVTRLPIALLADRALAEPPVIEEPTPLADEVRSAPSAAPIIDAPSIASPTIATPTVEAPAVAVAEPEPRTEPALPVVPRPSRPRAAARTAPPASPAEVLDRLLDLGIPESLLGADFTAQVAERGTYAALTRTLATRLPAPPEFPDGAGEVLFVVGPGVETLRAARALAASLRLDPDRVQWATRGDLAGLAPRSMTTIEAAIDRRQEAASSGTVTIVAVDAPMRTDAYWMAQMLAVWTPESVWALVEATRKPEDLEPWIAGLPRVDALVVQDTDLSADPAAVLHRLDAPVALLDGVRATPHRWASLLCERLEQRPE